MRNWRFKKEHNPLDNQFEGFISSVFEFAFEPACWYMALGIMLVLVLVVGVGR